VKNIRNLSNLLKVKELIDNNQNKIKFHNSSIAFGKTNDIDLNEFFSKICHKIWYITDSPSFEYGVNVGNDITKIYNYSTCTVKSTIEDLINLINNECLETNFIVFYLIHKVDETLYNLRFATIEDEGLKKIKNRDQKINRILDGKK